MVPIMNNPFNNESKPRTAGVLNCVELPARLLVVVQNVTMGAGGSADLPGCEV